MSTENSEEPQLIIDEDWKSQVQREKELLKQGKNAADSDTENEPADVAHVDNPSIEDDEELAEDNDGSGEEQPLPPASFEFLISGMATQAYAAMGLIPGNDGKPLPTRLDYARHYIDLLSIIEVKTAGNLSDAEKDLLKNTLHQLRMMFVSLKK